MEEEIIAKNNKNREVAESDESAEATTGDAAATDMLDGEEPEMPEEIDGMGGGPMGGGGFPGEMTMAQNDTNEWLAPMVGAGIASGVVIIAAVVIGWMIMRLEKMLKKVG